MEKYIIISESLIGKSVKGYKSKVTPNLLFNRSKYLDLSKLIIGTVTGLKRTRTSVCNKMWVDGVELQIEGRDGKKYRMQTGSRAVLDLL